MSIYKAFLSIAIFLLGSATYGNVITQRDTGTTSTVKILQLAPADAHLVSIFDCGHTNNSGNSYALIDSLSGSILIARSIFVGYHLDTVCLSYLDTIQAKQDTVELIVSNLPVSTTIRVELNANTNIRYCLPAPPPGMSTLYPVLDLCGHTNNSGNIYYTDTTRCIPIDVSPLVGDNLDTLCVTYTDTVQGISFTSILIVSNVDATTICDSVSCMLPGDADHDLTVNNFDLFAIGLSYGRTGVARDNASSAYTLQPSADWSTTHYYGYNDKFADCNGDGTINAQDASVIYTNYIEAPENIFHHRPSQSDTLPQVTLSFDTLPIIVSNGTCVGTQISGDINVNPAQDITNCYGIAFSVEYPAEFYDSCFSLSVDLDNNSWFVNNESVILFYKNIPAYHRVDVSVVRTNGINRSGSGRLGKIRFITEGDIFGRHLRTGSSTAYSFKVGMTAAINNRGEKIELYGSATTASFITLKTPQKEIQQLSVFPNPVYDRINIQAGEFITNITLLDILGKTVYTESPDSYQQQVDCSSLPRGTYFLQIQSRQAISVIRFIKE